MRCLIESGCCKMVSLKADLTIGALKNLTKTKTWIITVKDETKQQIFFKKKLALQLRNKSITFYP
jgi:hypothetical protein